MNYNKCDEPLKEYLRVVMDIYRALEGKNIKYKFFSSGKNNDKRANNFDKKILSMFMAGFFCSGSLRKITDNFDDIRKEDLLKFCDLREEEIVSTNEEEYASMFEDDFLLTISNVIEAKWIAWDINKLTPEVIFSGVNYPRIGSRVVDGFFGFINNNWPEHPVFLEAARMVKHRGDVTERKIPSRSNPTRGSGSSMMSSATTSTDYNDLGVESDNKEEKNSPKIDYSSDGVWDLCDDVCAKFIGQEQAAEGLFYNILNNQQMIQSGQMVDGQRSIIFLDGPTGTGKTAITRDITNKLDVTFVATSINNYSQTGYVGASLTDILVELYEKSGEDLKKSTIFFIKDGSFSLTFSKISIKLFSLIGFFKYLIAPIFIASTA